MEENGSSSLKTARRGIHNLGEHTYDNLSVINQFGAIYNNINTLSEKDRRILTMLGFTDLSKIPSAEIIPKENISANISKNDEDEFEAISLTEEDYLDIPENPLDR